MVFKKQNKVQRGNITLYREEWRYVREQAVKEDLAVSQYIRKLIRSEMNKEGEEEKKV